MAGPGKGAIFQAVVGNGILTVAKFGAFVVSGSGAMMSEAIHSFADTSNQALLYIGNRRSERPADDEFQYGYGADRFIFALIAAVGIFFLGCGVTIYHGVHSLMHPPTLELSWITFAVLGLAFVIDGYVLAAAVREVNHRRGKTGFVQFVKQSTDPTLIAVVFEDGVATLGVVIAFVGIIFAHQTGNPAFDAISSIVIGALMGLLALWLGWRNRTLILGPSLGDKQTKEVIEFLEEQPAIKRVRDMRTRIVGADRFRIAADVDYNGACFATVHSEWLAERAAAANTEEDWKQIAADFGDRIMETLGDEIDDIEHRMIEKFPRIRHIDMEVD